MVGGNESGTQYTDCFAPSIANQHKQFDTLVGNAFIGFLLTGHRRPAPVSYVLTSFPTSQFFKVLRFWSLAESWLNFATQIGAKRVTTCASAILSAVLPVTHPPQVKPATIVKMIEAIEGHNVNYFVALALLHRCQKFSFFLSSAITLPKLPDLPP